ncbi:hypothetical protein COV17_04025 [Candidatus Woesearchaeota archaeon CG10_big_fil_rev_8_21_14_0_10_36_11]|nr:MAG: hypothetical protein COV17_04025 [Candidatus Woesearchaeota archaeon CG10_big_fil_rev_8_21_14_0_10_36_11]
MQNLTILNTRRIKEFNRVLTKQFGAILQENYAYFLNEKSRIFIINRDIANVDLNKLKIDKIGLYFAEYKDNQARLSKEGAQLLVQENKNVTNVIELDEKEIKQYFAGTDLQKDCGKESKFILLQYKNHVLGCAKYKENTIINFLPKIHRGEVII